MNCIQKDYSFGKIEIIYFAIKLPGYTDPCSPFVASISILKAAKRLYKTIILPKTVHKTRKKSPITIDDLQ